MFCAAYIQFSKFRLCNVPPLSVPGRRRLAAKFFWRHLGGALSVLATLQLATTTPFHLHLREPQSREMTKRISEITLANGSDKKAKPAIDATADGKLDLPWSDFQAEMDGNATLGVIGCGSSFHSSLHISHIN